MSKTSLLQKLNKTLSPNKVDFSSVDAEINALKKKLEETVNIQTVDDVKYQLDKFKNKIDLTPLVAELQKISEQFTSKTKELQSQIDEKAKEMSSMKNGMGSMDKKCMEDMAKMGKDISSLKKELVQFEVAYDSDLKFINTSIEEVRDIEDRLNETINKVTDGLSVYQTKKDTEQNLKDAKKELDQFRLDMLDRFRNMQGGGNMNRQIFIGGNDPLTKFTDINLKAGNNVTISYVNNNTTKKVDVTLTASGSGGSVRSINSISTTTTAGDTSGTDYVYLCSGTFTLTLPTAVGNTNLYTVKNVGVGVITVDTTSSQTIDGDLTITMPVRYTSVDLISDTANWNVT